MKLLPCPFCGDEAEIERCGDRRRSTIYQCTSCGCSLETGEEWDHGAGWNTRAPPRSDSSPSQAPAVKCERCSGRREIGGFDLAENGYRTEPCPSCMEPAGQSEAGEEIAEALAEVQKELVLAIAFLGRDHGTDRLDKTVGTIIDKLALADRTARMALSAHSAGKVSRDAAEMRERAAKVLDNAAQDWNRIRDPGMANNARSYARKIRALPLASEARNG